MNWIDTSLGEYLNFKNGKSSPERSDSDPFPVYGSNGIIGYSKDTNSPENSLIIGRVGSYCGSVYHSKEKFWVTDNAILATPKNQEESEFWYFLLLSLNLNNYRSGSGQPLLNQSTLNSISIKIPAECKYRSSLGKMAMSFNDKIALNTQINQTLEAMAQALFKSWFVDFDPVKAKITAAQSLAPALSQREREVIVQRAAMAVISGKSEEELVQFEQENPEAFGQLAATADLFPEALVESELGLIPEGWVVSSVGEEFNVTMGQSPKGETYNETGVGTLFFQGRAEFTWRFPLPRLHTTDPKRMAKVGDTLMSVRAPVGDVNIALNDCCVGRGLCAVRHKSGCESYTYYQFLELKRVLDSYNGEGTVFGSINQNDLKKIMVVKPSIDIVRQFSSVVSDCDKEIKNRSLENLTLGETRDTLLPKLLSGEIDLSSFGDREVGE